MSVKAKFECYSVEDQGDNGKAVRLRAVVNGSEENKEWSKYTPSGDLSMQISNPDAAEQFAEGKEYYLTFEEAPSE